MRLSRVVVLLAALLLTVACTPQLQEIGPPVDTPAFTTKAFHTADGVDLPMKTWLPWDRPLEASLVALHGFNDYNRAFDAPGKGLARRGFAVYAFDQRGFGGTPQRGIWPGADQMIQDLATAATLAKAAHPDKPVYLIGESMGAAVILAAVAQHTEMPIDGIILAAPAIWGWQTQSPLNRKLFDFAMAVMPRVPVRPNGVYREPSNNYQMLRQMGRDPKVIKDTRVDAAFGLVELMTLAFDAGAKLGPSPRWLIMFCEREDILTTDSVARFVATLPDLPPAEGRLALYPQGYHMMLRDLQARIIYDDIAAWIRDPAAPLPSGADTRP